MLNFFTQTMKTDQTVDEQANLSLHWAQRSEGTFSWAAAQMFEILVSENCR